MNFEDFCTDLCNMVGVPAPSLDDAPEGERGFIIDVEGAEVTFTEGLIGDVQGVLMTTRFGPPPPDKEVDVLRALMNANLELADVGGPSFARDLEGDIFLHHTILLKTLDVRTVYASLGGAADALKEWNETYFLTPSNRSQDPWAGMRGMA